MSSNNPSVAAETIAKLCAQLDAASARIKFLESSECEAAWCERWKNICAELEQSKANEARLTKERDSFFKTLVELRAELMLCYDPERETEIVGVRRLSSQLHQAREDAINMADNVARIQLENARLAAACRIAADYLTTSEANKVAGAGPHYDEVTKALYNPSTALSELLGPVIKSLDLAASVIEAMRKDCLADPGAAIVAEQNCGKQATRLRAAIERKG